MVNKSDSEDDRELVGLSQSCRSKSWFKLLSFSLWIHNYDIFAVYKTNRPSDEIGRQPVSGKQAANNNSRNTTSISDKFIDHQSDHGHIFRSSSLRLEATKCDARRHKWTAPIRALLACLLVKAAVVSFAQYSLLKHQYLVPKGYPKPWLSVEWIKTMHNYSGNPYQFLKELSVFVTLFPPFFASLCYIIQPKYYAKYGLSVGLLRFLFNPSQELKRIDLCAKQILEQTRVSLGEYFAQKRCEIIDKSSSSDRLRRREGSRIKSPLCLPPERYEFNELTNKLNKEELYCFELNKFIDELELKRLRSLRPNWYSKQQFITMSNKLGTALVGVYANYSVITLINALGILAIVNISDCDSYKKKRQQLHSDPVDVVLLWSQFCKPWLIYTWTQLVGLLELPFMATLVTLSASLNLSLFIIVVVNQTNIIKSLRRELINCKVFMMQPELAHNLFSDTKPCMVKPSVRVTQVQPSFHPNTTNSLVLEPASRLWRRLGSAMTKQIGIGGNRIVSSQMSLDARLRVDKHLLELLIKMLVCKQDLLDNSASITKFTYQPLYYVGSVVFLALVSAQFKLADKNLVKYFIISACWSNFNLVALVCAHICSQIVALERLMLQIVARNAATFDGKFHPILCQADNVRHCTFATDLWWKYVRIASDSTDHYCARPLGFKLTYENIIELNFFILFVYSFSFGRI